MEFMEVYYRERAAEYDEFYEVPERLADLQRLRTWLAEHVRGRTILEVAAGTGHWTEAAANVAHAITATDYNHETLKVAAKRNLGPHVTLVPADAYALPQFSASFDCGMAHMWWSHVPKQRREQFLSHFVSRLQPGASILMIDQFFVAGRSTPVFRQDQWGNLLTMRTLKSGATYEIIKNYPSSQELRDGFAPFCDDVQILELEHFWALNARVRAAAA